MTRRALWGPPRRMIRTSLRRLRDRWRIDGLRQVSGRVHDDHLRVDCISHAGRQAAEGCIGPHTTAKTWTTLVVNHTAGCWDSKQGDRSRLPAGDRGVRAPSVTLPLLTLDLVIVIVP